MVDLALQEKEDLQALQVHQDLLGREDLLDQLGPLDQ